MAEATNDIVVETPGSDQADIGDVEADSERATRIGVAEANLARLQARIAGSVVRRDRRESVIDPAVRRLDPTDQPS